MGTVIHTFPVNRVEGDLEVRIQVEDGLVTDAWCMGIMYRGFENIMVGRSALDGLVITPRVCGICSTAHLKAAAKALDMILQVRVPDAALKIRNLALGVEKLQNDVRHGFLIFMSDFANPGYRNHSLYSEAMKRYEPLRGRSAIRTIRESARVVEIIAILGGQWPHSSFMVPGGVVSSPSGSETGQCRFLLNGYRKWYENRVLGCSVERWSEIRSEEDLDHWLHESEAHRDSDIGFFIRFSKEAGLDRIGKGHGDFISFGVMEMPEETRVTPGNGKGHFLPGGALIGPPGENRSEPLDQTKIAEETACSWFRDEGGLHPMKGRTIPYATGGEGDKYSWCKAPRYAGSAMETGPLAELAVAGHPLFSDLISRSGPNVFVRQLARLARPALLLPVLDQWLEELTRNREPYIRKAAENPEGEGIGMLEAPRGALGHWVRIENGSIRKYQIITPTSWNASPRDGNGLRGAMEEALIGTPVRDADDPMEVGHVIRSFDPCLVCTVHAVDLRRNSSRSIR